MLLSDKALCGEGRAKLVLYKPAAVTERLFQRRNTLVFPSPHFHAWIFPERRPNSALAHDLLTGAKLRRFEFILLVASQVALPAKRRSSAVSPAGQRASTPFCTATGLVYAILPRGGRDEGAESLQILQAVTSDRAEPSYGDSSEGSTACIV